MRKVKFKCYELVPNESNARHREFVEYTGVFHQWGFDSTEADSTIGTDTIGICELPDGTIKTPYPIHMQFLPDEPLEKEMD